MQVIIDEVIEQATQLTEEEREKLTRVLQEQKPTYSKNGGQNDVSPNTIWLRENRHKYGGMYVAVEDGKLVGTGKNYPETLADAEKSGAQKPFITYIFPVDSVPFGGW